MSPSYRPLGCLRLILAIFVLVQHALFLVPTYLSAVITPVEIGSIAVLLFFVVSGFVVTEAVFCFYRQRPMAFLRNRVLRLYPTYLLALAAFLVTELALNQFLTSVESTGPWPISALTGIREVIGNAFAIFPGSAALLSALGITPKIDLVWALRVEWIFYGALLALIALGIYIDRFKVLVAVFCASALALCYLFPNLASNSSAAFAPFFVLGMSGYLLVSAETIQARLLAAALAAVSSCWTIQFILNQAPFHEIGFQRSLTLQASVFLVGVLVMSGLVFLRINSTKVLSVDDRLGRLSYPLYLMHAPIFLIAAQLKLEKSMFSFFAVMIISVAFAWLTWRYFEQRFDAKRSRIRGRSLDIRTPPLPRDTGYAAAHCAPQPNSLQRSVNAKPSPGQNRFME